MIYQYPNIGDLICDFFIEHLHEKNNKSIEPKNPEDPSNDVRYWNKKYIFVEKDEILQQMGNLRKIKIYFIGNKLTVLIDTDGVLTLNEFGNDISFTGSYHYLKVKFFNNPFEVSKWLVSKIRDCRINDLLS